MKLSTRISSIEASATLAVSARAAAMQAEGIDVVAFGAGEPDFPTPRHIVEAAKRALDEGQTKYPKPASGLLVLKGAIREKLRRENGLEYSPDQVIVTVGGKMACAMALQAVINPGDEVIIPVPYWVSYPAMVKLAGGVPVFVNGDEEKSFCLRPEQIRDAITKRTRALLMNSPSNPGGFMYSPDQIRAIAEAVSGPDITVISDEIYDRLVYGDRRHLSFAAVGEDAFDRTITINSASKTYSMPGWRLGFAAGPAEVVKAMAKLQSQGTSGAATFAQIAYAHALTEDQSCVDEMRTEYARRGPYMHAKLNEISGLRCVEPAGAFYCFPNVGGTYARLGVQGSVEFADRLINEAHVAVVPGVAFGMDSHVRLSFATNREQIEKGLTRLADFVGRS